jgi:hypothetical protein
MLRVTASNAADRSQLSRRELLRVGGLAVAGLSLPELLRTPAAALEGATSGRAKSCIVLFLMGGPPQHSTWDPKPDAPEEVRGEFKPISTTVPGLNIGELLPQTAKLADRISVLRAVHTGDNAHSSSGYYMLTGVPHQPTNSENANPGAPNNWPNYASIIRHLQEGRSSMPGAVRLPDRIWNTDGSVWPGQDAGFLGGTSDPWLFRCEPASSDFKIPEFSLPAHLTLHRAQQRRALLSELDRTSAMLDSRSSLLSQYDGATQQAFDLLTSPRSRTAFQLADEPDAMRERYGHSQFGQSVLLSRRLVEAGVRLVQVNWYRGPDEPDDAPCWDSHAREAPRLKTVLLPPFDQAYSALLEDLQRRNLLDETLVVCMSEFGRGPRINAQGGRGHWGNVFSITLAGGGIRGGTVLGASDALGGEPAEGVVHPPDILATIFHQLGIAPSSELQDPLGRPFPISRGKVIREILA